MDLTDLDKQIADLEREIAALPPGKRNRRRRELERERDWLLRRVQWATVGAAKPGQVL